MRRIGRGTAAHDTMRSSRMSTADVAKRLARTRTHTPSGIQQTCEGWRRRGSKLQLMRDGQRGPLPWNQRRHRRDLQRYRAHGDRRGCGRRFAECQRETEDERRVMLVSPSRLEGGDGVYAWLERSSQASNLKTRARGDLNGYAKWIVLRV
jgi:hypothetical protein